MEVLLHVGFLVLCAYGAFAFQLIVHELGHAAVAAACGMEVLEVRVGSGRWAVRAGRASFSPVLFGGTVRVSVQSFKRQSSWVCCLFFAVGPLANLVLAAGSIALIPAPFGLLAGIAGFALAVGSMVPLGGTSDGAMILAELRGRGKRS